jgi:hypothetical protein
MFSNRLSSMAGGVVFLLIALVGLYRLMFWFPVVIAGWQVGQTVSFFTFVIFTALSIVSFQGLRTTRTD